MKIMRSRASRGIAGAPSLVLWLAIGLPACARGSSGGGVTGPAGSALVAFCDSAEPACASGTDFSIPTVRDLYVWVGWMNVKPGYHLQTLKIYLPDQNLYQAFETPFEVVDSVSGSATLVKSLPVAGSAIEQRTLAGAWRAEVFLDGTAKASRFVLLTP